MPGRIQQIRKSIDTGLDSLQAQAEAFDAQLVSTKREAQQRIERQKQALRDALDYLKKELQRQSSIAEDKRKHLATAIDEFKVQIALGRADALDVLEAQLKKVRESVTKFEAQADGLLTGTGQQLNAAADIVIRRYVQACDALHAELQAAVARLKREVAERGPSVDKRKRELDEKIGALKRQLAEQRKRQAEKWKQFQREMEPGLRQIAKAFKDLVS